MNSPTPQNKLTDHETNSWLAYKLWENAGRPDGRAQEFWLQAELMVGVKKAVLEPAAPARNGAAHNGSPHPAKSLQDATPPKSSAPANARPTSPRGQKPEPELAHPRTIKPAKRGSLKSAN